MINQLSYKDCKNRKMKIMVKEINKIIFHVEKKYL